VGSVKSARIVRKRDNSGDSMGFGFVEFETPEEAVSAIDQLNDTHLDGRDVRVRCAGPAV
jgi:RNA recognition motif-containing protein